MFSAGNLLKNSFLLSLCKYTFLLIILTQNPKLNWSSSCALLFDNVQIEDISDFYHQLFFYRILLDYHIIHKEGEGTINKYNLIFGEGIAL